MLWLTGSKPTWVLFVSLESVRGPRLLGLRSPGDPSLRAGRGRMAG